MNKPNEKPIIFSTPMIQAILDGRKSQTRRIVKLPNAPNHLGEWEPSVLGGKGVTDSNGNPVVDEVPVIWHTRTGKSIASPYGVVGDRLWVRETYSLGHVIGRPYGDELIIYKADWVAGAQDFLDKIKIKWKSPRFMPRWASRILLEIAGVRVERLQDITEEDAIAEGVFKSCSAPLVVNGEGLQVVTLWDGREEFYIPGAAKSAYLELFTSIYGPDAVEEIPWVWVIDFKEVE